MKMQITNTKRKLCGALTLLSVLPGCNAMGRVPPNAPNLTDAQRRLKDVGLVLVVDAVPGVEMLGNEFFADGSDRPFYASSTTRKGNRAIMAFPISVVPERVRVVWRKSDKWAQVGWGNASSLDELGKSKKNYIPPDGKRFDPDEEIARRKVISAATGVPHHGPWGSDYGDEVLGDHTLTIASRIPDEVVKEIRKKGGGLRLKFRLKCNGVLFGWDIERFAGGLPRHSMPGGDFLETEY